MDEQLFFLINGSHTSFLDGFMYLVSQKAVWVPLYLSLLYVVWRNYSWRGIITVLLMVGIGMLITDWANAHLLRPWIGRLRPSNPENPIAPLVHIVNDRRGHGCGMPSAHSANIWLLTFVMIHWCKDRWMSVTMVLTAVVVCYSRVYLGFHYPGDIMGGLLLAALTAAGIFFLHRKYLFFCPKTTLRHTFIAAIVAALTMCCFVIMALLY